MPWYSVSVPGPGGRVAARSRAGSASAVSAAGGSGSPATSRATLRIGPPTEPCTTILASARIARASAVSSRAASHVTEIGLGVCAATAATARATFTELGPRTFVSTTTTASTSGSATTAAHARSKASGSPTNSWAVVSTGLIVDPKAGTTSASAARVASERSASFRPLAAIWSAARAPAPPELVSTPIRRPPGRRPDRSSATASSSSSASWTAIAPARSLASSKAASAETIAPVCERAATRPSSVRPERRTTIRTSRCAALASSSSHGPPSGIVSKFIATMRISGSSSSSPASSVIVTPDWLPTLHHAVRPIPRSRARPRNEPPSAPLWPR